MNLDHMRPYLKKIKMGLAGCSVGCQEVVTPLGRQKAKAGGSLSSRPCSLATKKPCLEKPNKMGEKKEMAQ